MERWQSHFENEVRFNLSDSGVHPLTLEEFRELAGVDPRSVLLGYTQTNGTEALRERIAAMYPGAAPSNVIATSGSAEANFVSLWHLVEPGDRVVVVLPTYGQAPGLLEGLNADVATVHLREELGWQPAPGELAAAITPETRLIMVTNPNNPTGSRLAAEAMEEIAGAAERAGAWIVADEVYRGAEVDGVETPSFWGRGDRVLATGSLSKAYGLPGLRLGWIVGPAPEMEALWSRKDYTTICPGALSDFLGEAALRPAVRDRLLERTRGILAANRDVVAELVASSDGVLSWLPPEAGAICYLRYALDLNSTELADRLRTEHETLIVPGDHFGMDGYLRVGHGVPTPELREALLRLGNFLVEAVAADGADGPRRESAAAGTP